MHKLITINNKYYLFLCETQLQVSSVTCTATRELEINKIVPGGYYIKVMNIKNIILVHLIIYR